MVYAVEDVHICSHPLKCPATEAMLFQLGCTVESPRHLAKMLTLDIESGVWGPLFPISFNIMPPMWGRHFASEEFNLGIHKLLPLGKSPVFANTILLAQNPTHSLTVVEFTLWFLTVHWPWLFCSSFYRILSTVFQASSVASHWFFFCFISFSDFS